MSNTITYDVKQYRKVIHEFIFLIFTAHQSSLLTRKIFVAQFTVR